MSTVYRMHQPSDREDLVKFWNENSEWDQIDQAEWDRRFFYTPNGPACVALAEDNGEIISQLIFIPHLITVEGKKLNGSRPFALIVKHSHRPAAGVLKMVDLIYNLYQQGTRHLRDSGTSVVYMLPDPRWSRMLKFLPGLQVSDFPLWSLPLPLAENFQLPGQFSSGILAADDERLDELALRSSQVFNCSLWRNSQSLEWKASHATYALIGTFCEGKLVGAISGIAKFKDKQFLICDIIVTETGDILRATLMAACNYANTQFAQDLELGKLNKAAILATPQLEPVISGLGFRKETYKFPFLVHLLDPSLTKKQVAPVNWHVSAND